MNKTLKVMTSAALLAGVVAPVVASADSKNVVTAVPQIADDFESKALGATQLGYVDGNDFGEPVSSIIIKEENVPFTEGQIFRVTLPEGVEFVTDAYDGGNGPTKNNNLSNYLTGATVENVSKKVLELKIDVADVGTPPAPNTNVDTNLDQIVIPMYVKVNGATGEIKATIESLDTTITPGTYTFAKVGVGDTTTVVEEVKTIGETGTLGTIRIDENSRESMGTDAQKVTFKLPSKFKWSGVTGSNIKFSGGFSGTWNNVSANVDADNDGTITANEISNAKATLNDNQYFVIVNGSTLDLYFNPASRAQRGSIYLENAGVSVDESASFGEVELNVSGDKVTDQDIVVANYADYEIKIEAKDEPKEIVAGLLDDNDALKATKVVIKESVADSIVTGRKVKVKFPSWVNVVDVRFSNDSEVSYRDMDSVTAGVQKFTRNKDRNEVEFEITNLSSKADFEIEFYLTVQADKTGDITAKFESRSGIEGEVVVAKAVAPVTVEVKPTDVLVGVKGQQLGEIIITENKKGALKEGNFTITLPDNLKFSKTPTVEVVEGNIDLGDVELVAYASDDDRQLQVKVDSVSTKASKIKITGAEIDLDRTVPVGAIAGKLGGSFIENSTTGNDEDTDLFKDKDAVAEIVLANVVTPAPGQSVSKEVKFTIGSTTYTVAGEEKTLDAAPFIEGGRTYLPIRYVAEAVGIGSDSIFWDQATQTATLIKGDRVVQLTAGSNVIKINGASITIDSKAQVKDGRTFLPIRAVATALGASVDWNQADNTVTVK